jgi:hypothetical protein
MFGGNLIGHGRTSIIRWRGPEAPDDPLASPVGNYSIIRDYGASYFNYKGLVWDGSGTAAVGVNHFSRDLFSTFMLHRLEAFLNFKVAGVRVGGTTVNPATEKLADSEVRWEYLQFSRSFYGILLNSFNDLDNMFHGASICLQCKPVWNLL